MAEPGRSAARLRRLLVEAGPAKVALRLAMKKYWRNDAMGVLSVFDSGASAGNDGAAPAEK
jgi:hypothetical protein